MKTTIEMAKEAGLLTWLKPPEDVIERFKAFEALVREDERDACAKVCFGFEGADPLGVSLDCAAAIQARGNT
jgi:hypothetical protein